MKFLQPNGTVIEFVRSRNANADQSEVRANKKPRIYTDWSSVNKRRARKQENLLARIEQRKILKQMRRSK
jgi:hypothetical protein